MLVELFDEDDGEDGGTYVVHAVQYDGRTARTASPPIRSHPEKGAEGIQAAGAPAAICTATPALAPACAEASTTLRQEGLRHDRGKHRGVSVPFLRGTSFVGHEVALYQREGGSSRRRRLRWQSCVDAQGHDQK